MASGWYYVEGSNRVGPVEENELQKLYNKGSVTEETYIWRKGLGDNWQKLQDVDELSYFLESPVENKSGALTHDQTETKEIELPPFVRRSVDWDLIDKKANLFTIKIGPDRGAAEVEYGPYSLEILKKLFKENRISQKTYVFTPGMDDWTLLADLPIYGSYFSGLPPKIADEDRRRSIRKPFVARMFFHDNKDVFEGICRDISVGGLQVLVSNPPCSVGDNVFMNVHPENTDHCFVAKGKVVRILEGRQGFSLRFEGLGQESIKAIGHYVE